MYIKSIFCVPFAFLCIVNAQQNSCIKADGKLGKCISIDDCKSISKNDINTIRNSYCGSQGKTTLVCCSIQLPPASCYTPEEKPGQCISLNECPNLRDLLRRPVDDRLLQYVERSRCDGPDQYNVCCGPAPNLTPAQTGGCETKVSAFPPDPASGCCGVDSTFGNKISGGNATKIDEHPWLALIEYVSDAVKTSCGGALISGKYVLTAGHCVLGQILINTGTPANIRLGEFDTGNEGKDCVPTSGGGMDCTEGVTRIPIEKIIPYPQYVPPIKKHDIALIRMAHMAPFTDFIRPICLPHRDATRIPMPFNVTVAGWGAINENVSKSSIKLQVELPFMDKDQCQTVYHMPQMYKNLWEGQICAGGEAGKDSCRGDSGGPLMYQNGKTYEVMGIVSFGPEACGLEHIPGVYTNIFPYNPWIRSNIVP